jgi:hypothetical protein
MPQQSTLVSFTAAQFGRRYGFAHVELSETLLATSSESSAILEIEKALESLARVIALGAEIPMEQARPLCGIGSRLGLRLLAPTEFPDGVGAKFDPANATMSVSGSSALGRPSGAHLGHEWAHGLDFCLGSELAPSQSASVQAAPIGVSRFEGAKSITEASLSAAPYQSILGALAIGQAEKARTQDFYASLAIAQGQPTALPAFARLAKSLLPGLAKKLRPQQRAGRAVESAMQENKLVDFAHAAALDCIRCDENIRAMQLSDEQTESIAKFCAKALVSRSTRESSRRRGREGAIDLAKKDIATMLRSGVRMTEDGANELASSIIHIAPMKARYDDFYAAPYTGRSHWDSPGSLADLSCALIRVCRNQRALSNAALSKEKFIPMAFWWSMRRQVSEISGDIESRAESLIGRLAEAGMLDSDLIEHAKQWSGARGEYRAGALVFSDLVGTGAKMIRQEADLMGQSIDEKSARALRRKIAAPINDLAKRKTIIESIAESFEQFIQHQSGLSSRLGRACKDALAHSIVDSDPLETTASLDPSLSWMHNKDGDAAGNSRRWRALLRELPSLVSMSVQAPKRSRKP